MQRAHNEWLIKMHAEVSPDVEKTAGFIGTVLSDKLDAIRAMNTKQLRKFCKADSAKSKFAGSYEILNEVLDRIGRDNTKRLANEEIFKIQDAFRLSTLQPKSGPFAHLTFGKWFSLLTSAEGSAASAPVSIKESGPKQPVAMIDQLKSDVSRLRNELLKTLEAEKSCPVSEFMHLHSQARALSYSIEGMERRIAASMSASRAEIVAAASQGMSVEEVEESGVKHANLLRQVWLTDVLKIPGLKVPAPFGVTSSKMRDFLDKETPNVFVHWQQIGALYAEEAAKSEGEKTPFLDKPEVAELLKEIDQELERIFIRVGKEDEVFKSLGLSAELQSWLEEVRSSGKYLMVRSTGAEDSRKLANAGGNTSKSYVPATREAFCQAAGEVLRSYFGRASLQNRLNAKINPFDQELKLAVTSQELIGEPIGGSKRSSEIPISLVLFTNEPLYVGGEKFRVMRLSASYGHGEGVVGNLGIASDTALILRSEAHPDKLYMLYDNREKPVRLAPVQGEEGVVLEKVDNPPDLIKKPVLNAELLTRLYHWGIVGEKFFDDFPTDMEIVIKDDVIYPVQARPVNRPDLLPTYLDLKKVTALEKSPILQKSQGEMIVPGQASVVILQKPEELLVAETLEQAEKLYRRDIHKVVVVHQEEPANSHPVVNFSSLGVPCLYIKNKDEVSGIASQITDKQPLAVCVQTATLNLWNQDMGAPDQFVSKGFAVHPAKIIASLSLEHIPAKAALVTPEVPQEVRDLYMALRASTTKQVALNKLKEFREHGWIQQASTQKQRLEKRLKEIKFTPKQAMAHFSVLEELDDTLQQAFSEMEAALKGTLEGGRLQPLFHAKVLDTLLFTPPRKDGALATYSVIEVEPVSKGIETLIDYQKQLPHAAHLADIVLDGTAAFTPEKFQSWQDFLLQLEPLVEKGTISAAEVVRLKEFVLALRETGSFPGWLTFFFNPSSSPSAGEYFQSVLASVKDSDVLLLKTMQRKQKELLGLRNLIPLFSEPDKFSKAWEALQGQVAAWLGKDMMEGASPIASMAVIKTMQELTDVFDLSIKALKASSKFDQGKKLELFKEMLQPYFALLQDWILLPGSFAIPKHSEWPLSTYIQQMESILYSFRSNREPQLMTPSRGFSVSAAMLGSSTAFERHYPETLEDFFTLTHQNIMACLSSNNNQLLDLELAKQAGLPPLLEQGMLLFSSSTARIIHRMGIEVNEERIVVKYNVPLRNHSGTLELHYDKATGTVTFKGKLLGEGRDTLGRCKVFD